MLQPSTGSWSNANNWWDLDLGAPALAPPGASDTATIPVNANCTVTSGVTVENVSVAGTFTVESTLDIDGNPNAGLGNLAIGGGAVTVGGPNGTSSGTIDTDSVSIGSGSGGGSGSLAIGAPGSGMGGFLDVSGGMTNAGTLTIGGAGGSSGALDVSTITDGGPTTIYANGGVDVDTSGAFTSTALVIAGGVINAENINAYTGASVTISGATITNGPLSGNLNAEENASFTFTGPVTLGAGATLGDGTFNIEAALTVNTDLTVSNAEFYLENNGSSTLGSIGGTGSIEWYNHEFDWEGGTIGGLTGGGFTIEGQADFDTTGANTKTLATTMTNLGPSTVDIGGAGGLASTGAFINEASSVVPMEISTDITGAGTFTNAGYLNIVPNGGSPSSVIISAPLNNTDVGVLDVETGAGTLTLADTSGTSILDGSIGLSSNGLTISGDYATDSSVSIDSSGGTTLTGTFTVDSGASADIDALILSGGTITGAGDVTLHGDCSWVTGTISGSGELTVWGDGTLTLSGGGTESRNMDNQGTVEWLTGSRIAFSSGTTVLNDLTGVFDYENDAYGLISTFNNEGLLELYAGDMLMVDTFTQTSKGTLQSDLDSGTSFGSLHVTGAATLDGNAENGYSPSSGTSFTVLDFGSSSGQFATVDPQGWSAQYNSTSVDLIAG